MKSLIAAVSIVLAAGGAGSTFVPGPVPQKRVECATTGCYVYNDGGSYGITIDGGTSGGSTTIAAFGSAPNANGGTIAAGVLTLQPADGTNPGGVSLSSQTFAGAKTFSASLSSTVASGSNAINLLDGARLNLSTADLNAYLYRCAADTVCAAVALSANGSIVGGLAAGAGTYHKFFGNNAGALFGVQNNNAGGFSGIEYFDNSGNVAVFTGYNNGSPGEFRFNNIASGGHIDFKIAGVTELSVLNSGAVSVAVGVSLARHTLSTCASGIEGQIESDILSGAATGKRTKHCLCTSNGSSVYAWQNLATGTIGTTTTCGTE